MPAIQIKAELTIVLLLMKITNYYDNYYYYNYYNF